MAGTGKRCHFNLCISKFQSPGAYVRYTGPTRETSTKVSSLIDPGDSNHRIRFTHYGGPTGIYISGLGGPACGDLYYKIYYGEGPVLPDDLDYETELNNTAFNKTETGFDLAVTAYQAVAGCVLGQAGKKGGMLDGLHSAIPGWNDYITDEVTESPAYLVGQVACGMAFPYATTIRDFSAELMRGEYEGAALQSVGFLGPVRTLLGTTDVIPLFIAKNVAKNPQKINSGQEIMSHLWRHGIYHTELPAIEKAAMLDKAFDGAATRLSGQGVADDVIAAVYENNGNIAKTLKAGARADNGKARWLEEGWTEQEAINAGRKSATGWKHIVEDHVRDGAYTDISKNDFAAAFDPTGTNYRNAETIQELIMDCVMNGKVNPSKPIEYYKKVTDTKAIRVIIGDNGYIRTAYPMKISEVPIPLP